MRSESARTSAAPARTARTRAPERTRLDILDAATANFVVDNRPGASGTVGHGSVARARADGYTPLLGVNSTYAMSCHLFPNRGYDDDTAFRGIGRVAVSPIFLCVNPRIGVSNIAELIAKAKEAPGRMSYASSGAGSSAHLATELFLRSVDIRIENVTYRGSGPAVQALITNEVQVAMVDGVTALPLMQAGQIRAMGVSTPTRNPLATDVPTIAESGFSGFEATSNFALLAPAGPPEQWPAYFRAESTKWGELIRARGITAE